MDATENPSFRSSKMSRLPAPSTAIGGGGGLTEWSESQHNARIQSTVTSLASLKNLKREIPQPASQSEAKRKPLSDRALEYPTKPTSLAAATSAARSNMKAQSLAGMSGLKQPSSFQTSRSGMGSSFAKSVGPGRHAPSNQPQASRMHPRPGHARSKSQAPRPRTAHGLRDEDRYEPAPSNSMSTTSQPVNSQPLAPLHSNKVRAVQSAAVLSTRRDSSLTSRFTQLSLDDDNSLSIGNQVFSRPATRQSSQSSLISQTSTIASKRHSKDNQNGKLAATSRLASPERT
ncbi:hypothetical protein FDECE_1535 [Fusarium decemcellulare]|nr:hypothetical protein FDECE_1535 [Fusarium decemcellulare]